MSQTPAPRRFVAIDFETADSAPDSACAIGMVRVEEGSIVGQVTRLIRPPRPDILFTWLHGIAWHHVKDEPVFGDVWPELSPMLQGVDFIAAHNAPFDRGVLRACCAAAGLPAPTLPFQCTVQVARKVWGIRPTKLDNVCRHLGIPLRHHDAGSDAEACARILIAAGV